MAKLQATDRRVVIESVSPQVDGGGFPAKSVIGDQVMVEASVFADGHDQVVCLLRHRAPRSRKWIEAPMEPLGNDRWRASFTPEALGIWQFEVEGWVDHFETWLDGLGKKAEAGLELDVDLRIGADLYDGAATRAGGDEALVLADAAAKLRDPKRSETERLGTATSRDVVTAARRHPDRSRATRSRIAWPVVVDREKAVFSTWYELFPRSWSKKEGEHGTFADVEARLDYIAGMGFDVLYLAPIHPIGTTYRKGANNALEARPGDPGVPWAIGSEQGGHTSIDPALGTVNDFRSLRDSAAARGVELALDIAFQCSPDHPWVEEHPEWFRHRPDGSVQYAENPPKKYQDIYPLDFETEDAEGLWLALKGVFDHWIGEGIRVFRVDNPHTKAFPFWDWVIPALRAEHPDLILLAEAFTRPSVMYRLAKAGFNQSYTYFAWRTSKHELTEYMADLAEVGHYFRPAFWPNTPDILTEQLQTGGRPAFISRYVLAATLSSVCGIYGPAYELMEHRPLQPGSEEYFRSEKYQIRHWDLDRDRSLAPFITRVNRARRRLRGLQRMTGLVFHPTDNDMIVCYSKGSASEAALMVVSLDPHHTQAGWVELDPAALGLAPDGEFAVHDLLTDRRYRWQGRRNYVELDPSGIPAHLFAVRAQAAGGRGA